MTERRTGMGFRHFFGVRPVHVEALVDLEQWIEGGSPTIHGGGYKVRALTTYTEFVGGDEFRPGEEIVFSFSSCPIVENGRKFPYSRQIGNTIAKGRYDLGRQIQAMMQREENTEKIAEMAEAVGKRLLTVVSQAKSINEHDKLPSALMIARVAQDHPKFGEYRWYKGPLRVSLEVEVHGFAIRDRLEPVHDELPIDSFVCGDGSAYRDTIEQREQRRRSREAKGLPYTPRPSDPDPIAALVGRMKDKTKK